jgi:hypothetical protein
VEWGPRAIARDYLFARETNFSRESSVRVEGYDFISLLCVRVMFNMNEVLRKANSHIQLLRRIIYIHRYGAEGLVVY